MDTRIWENPSVIKQTKLISDCYTYWTGKKLFEEIASPEELAEAVYNAPFVVVSHGTEKDPVFNYGNKKGQELWQISWEEFTSMPSRLSAEPIEESRRNELLGEGRRRGITYLEKGVRISKDGKRFYIKDVILFNLFTEEEKYLGQGAVYQNWEFID